MKVLVVVSCLVALARATPGYLGATTYAAGLGIAPFAAPLAAIPGSISTQYHAQDELGQYSYGYSGGPSAKQEVRAVDGSVAGAYSYVDAHGLVQSAQYASDPINGFRVAATNDPSPAASLALHAPKVVAAVPAAIAAPGVVVESPEVVAARSAHLVAKAAILGRRKRSPGIFATPAATALAAPLAYAAPAVVPARSFAYSAAAAHPAQIVPAGPAVTYAAPAVAYSAPAVAYSAPAVAYSAPAVAYSAPAVVAGSSQHHAQDELGQYTYGYADGNSAKTETRAADGSTVGGYSYVDGNGLVQSVKYHADALGFRVAATNLPVGPI